MYQPFRIVPRLTDENPIGNCIGCKQYAPESLPTIKNETLISLPCKFMLEMFRNGIFDPICCCIYLNTQAYHIWFLNHCF